MCHVFQFELNASRKVQVAQWRISQESTIYHLLSKHETPVCMGPSCLLEKLVFLQLKP